MFRNVVFLIFFSFNLFSLPNFSYTIFQKYEKIEVNCNGSIYNYFLVKNLDDYKKKLNKNEFLVKVPIKKAIYMNSTILLPVEKLGELESIVGLDDFWTTIPSIQKLIQEKKIDRVGYIAELNREKILELAPDTVFLNIFSTNNFEVDMLKNLNTVPVVMADWLEKSPLDRLEWIYFISCFYCKQDRALTIIKKITENYITNLKMVEKLAEKNSIIFNLPNSGKWVMPGGDSYLMEFFKTINFNYIFNNNKTGSVAFDIETVFAKGQNCDFWIIHNADFESKKELISGLIKYDKRLLNFKPLKNSKIFVNNKFKDDKGNNKFFDYAFFMIDRFLLDIKNISENRDDLFFYRELN